jgi:SAM-dependent methyltransferase
VGTKEYWDREGVTDPSYCKALIDDADRAGHLRNIEFVERKMGHTFSGRVLELGGGSQYFSRYLAEKRPCEVICTDISSARLNLFSEYYGSTPPNLTLQGGVNAEDLGYEDGEFDFIIGYAMIHHVGDLRTGLLEINRCLKPNGKAVFFREPVIGSARIAAERLGRLVPSVEQRLLLIARINRYEYYRTQGQWHEEFFMGGFNSYFYPDVTRSLSAKLANHLSLLSVKSQHTFLLEKRFSAADLGHAAKD